MARRPSFVAQWSKIKGKWWMVLKCFVERFVGLATAVEDDVHVGVIQVELVVSKVGFFWPSPQSHGGLEPGRQHFAVFTERRGADGVLRGRGRGREGETRGARG